MTAEQAGIEETQCTDRSKGFNIFRLAGSPGDAFAWVWDGFIDPDGNAVTITNLFAFCREHDLSPVCMDRLAKGTSKRKSAKGWTHRNSVRQRDFTKAYTGFIAPDSNPVGPITNLAAFCRKHGLETTHMVAGAHSRICSHRGWTYNTGRRRQQKGHTGFVSPVGQHVEITNLVAFCRDYGLNVVQHAPGQERAAQRPQGLDMEGIDQMSNQQHEAGAPLHKFTNHLIHETSPYLLQHAHNPVEWYSWGDEAFEKAKREDKPVYLSVGYSSCHWCHVMAHESFENEDTARLMNDDFVSIKVDREERPDVDALYMDAVQALTGSGGWPMSVFLTPDGAPFFGGTYFPPVDRYGMPGFPTLLRSIAALYRDRRDDVARQADEFRQFYRERSQVRLTLPENIQPASAVVSPSVLFQAADRLLAQLDAVEGGFGRAPKFPHPMGLELLLRVASRAQPAYSDNTRLLQLVRLTLDKMADGGIYDQVGGGFHRYSTDTYWLVPHFEKMLYDNALLAPVYLHAWQYTGDARYRRICEESLDYVLREMTDPSGGFYSTQDADSEGEEGKFYVWTPAEIRAVLGDEDTDVLEALWGFSKRGNFEGCNILHIARPLEDVAAEHDMSEDELAGIVARARTKLYNARAARVWPARDDKVLAAWNGFMLRAIAEAARLLGRDDYRQAAIRNATFITAALAPEGRLRRSWRVGRARHDAYLEDYAAVVNGLLTTYETTGDIVHFTSARAFADTMIARFWDEEAGAFFDTARDAERLIGRPREFTDNATPSGTSLAAEALLRLSAFTGDDRYRELAVRILVPLAPAMADSPSSFGHLLCALDDFVGPFYEVAIVGASDSPDLAALVGTLAERYLPRFVFARSAPDDTAAQSAVPLLADRSLVDGHAAAYVCQHFVCRQPVTDPDALLALLQP